MMTALHRVVVGLCYIAAAVALCEGAFLVHAVVGWLVTSVWLLVLAGWLMRRAPKISPAPDLSVRGRLRIESRIGELQARIEIMERQLHAISSPAGSKTLGRA